MQFEKFENLSFKELANNGIRSYYQGTLSTNPRSLGSIGAGVAGRGIPPCGPKIKHNKFSLNKIYFSAKNSSND